MEIMEPSDNKDRNLMEGSLFHHIKVNVRRQDSTEHMEVSLGKDCVANKERKCFYIVKPEF